LRFEECATKQRVGHCGFTTVYPAYERGIVECR
jgi:hypothetical protein